MITVRVKTFQGAAAAQAIAAEFDETGGNIGRAPDNQLVLPDPGKHISRVQASIVFRAGGYVVVDRGSANPVVLNGRALGNGNSAPLKDGDELSIGEYVLQVMEMSAPAARPAAAPDRGVGMDFGSPPPAPVSPVPLSNAADPLGIFGGAAAPGGDPFADLLGSSVPPSQPAAPSTPRPAIVATPPLAQSSSSIPDDFDPFSDAFAAQSLHAEAPLAAAGQLPEDFSLGISPSPASGSGQSIDALFGLSPGSPSDLLAPGSTLGGDISQPNTAPVDDPLMALGLGRAATAAPTADQVPEIHSAFTPPAAIPEGTLFGAPAQPAAPAKPPAAGGADANMFLSWENAPATSNASPPRAQAMPSVATAVPAPPPAAATPARARAAPSAPATGGNEALMRALATGLGMPDLSLPQGITPESMEMIGHLLHDAVQGTVDLLLARATTKREVKADVTMIVGRGNNPLKFAPDVATALQLLLMPAGGGFMAPSQAMQDAYDDLRSHQFGFMAGMRAALAGVLARFDPQQLEQRLTQKSMIDSLLPMNRRAKLWDLFAEMYKDISQEAEDDFHELFGREFLRAYEEQVAKLRGSAK